ncbi:TnsA-like heteromeric transposase endonuclease subunit [Streptomyces ferrugineus]|uniref:TnsA-like heteromeric transposase endonuclease subunit n=1 Tax=Streptomyces ferrugineus TaxID=1413221 RepID=A0A7M2SBX8_9ACTN|nr:TnsA-like heteromeric transposase endonuclease subunit [Streptomyces ferrugineus]QOV33235.1 TnsA-like heteromeric transposase endonuclease subunit [Streptomyces ferrugineus]
MARELRVLHQDQYGVRRTRPAERMAEVPLTERGEVWQPSRHPSQRSIVTWWWAATNRRLVGCRSLDRLSMAMLLDFHPGVVDFSAWAAQLVWREKGRQRQLVPDFFVRTAAGQTLVVACPPQTGPSGRFERQLAVLREACEQTGWQLAAPRLPGTVALVNLRWVSRRRHPRYGDAEVEAALARSFTRPRPLMEGVEACGVPRTLALPRLYHMLWHRRLGVDWSVPLGPGAAVGPLAAGEPDAVRRPLATEQP